MVQRSFQKWLILILLCLFLFLSVDPMVVGHNNIELIDESLNPNSNGKIITEPNEETTDHIWPHVMVHLQLDQMGLSILVLLMVIFIQSILMER